MIVGGGKIDFCLNDFIGIFDDVEERVRRLEERTYNIVMVLIIFLFLFHKLRDAILLRDKRGNPLHRLFVKLPQEYVSMLECLTKTHLFNNELRIKTPFI